MREFRAKRRPKLAEKRQNRSISSEVGVANQSLVHCRKFDMPGENGVNLK